MNAIRFHRNKVTIKLAENNIATHKQDACCTKLLQEKEESVCSIKPYAFLFVHLLGSSALQWSSLGQHIADRSG
ncbi:hypothetical protein DdX_03915 [Ditylenchus destructor]|uniref:Uncharacterized protein n=1 Tax=Ditylenchus destructor TaxID=166010 RepID=A0AAD4R5A1_9BILA|nr:hypothetical protein DdX_03915 [Ditylenchus destructor]